MAEITSTPMRLLSDLAFRHWGTKLVALMLATVLFVLTRDEVNRAFEVPLRVIADPNRVLLTDLPETIQVQVRGPWTRVNRLQDYDFGAAALDLRSASPGPLEIDRASIVMPPGVILAAIQYDHVDLRFDPVVEREVAIDVAVVGRPAPDYEVERLEVQPERWMVRGGESFLQPISHLFTEAVDIAGATDDIVQEVAIVRPDGRVRLVGDRQDGARVTVRVVIEPRAESRSYAVPVVVADDLDPTGAVPRTFQVELSGPMPDFRILERLGIAFPVEAHAELVSGTPQTGGVVEVHFSWALSVPEDVRGRLHRDHGVERVSLPPAPALDLPDGGQ